MTRRQAAKSLCCLLGYALGPGLSAARDRQLSIRTVGCVRRMFLVREGFCWPAAVFFMQTPAVSSASATHWGFFAKCQSAYSRLPVQRAAPRGHQPARLPTTGTVRRGMVAAPCFARPVTILAKQPPLLCPDAGSVRPAVPEFFCQVLQEFLSKQIPVLSRDAEKAAHVLSPLCSENSLSNAA